jgi:hypothetical protein
MKTFVLFVIAVTCCALVAAADFKDLAASCIGLDDAGTKRCLAIVARHTYGPFHNLRPFTLAEKTAIDAIMAADSKAVIVVLPDGSFVIGQTFPDRVIGIPCEANPCPSR